MVQDPTVGFTKSKRVVGNKVGPLAYTKLVPKVPMFDPFDTDFEFNDVIVDTSLQWLEELWEVFDGELKTLPTKVFGEEGYGSKTSKQLSV